jgi:hypothetical protein
MGFWSFLNHWWNLPSLVLLGLCAAFVLLQALGLLGAGDDHDLALDGHADADVDLDLDGDLDGAADHDLDADGDASGAAPWHEVLGFLGAGRVPFMVVWVSLFLCAGFAGIFLNRALFLIFGGYSGWWFAPVQLLALATGVIGARLSSNVVGRFVDVGGRGATQKQELTGRLGVVASAVCNDRFGEIRVNDRHGNELLVHGHLAAGDAPLARSASVVLVDFDPERELFSVAAFPEPTEPEPTPPKLAEPAEPDRAAPAPRSLATRG